MKKLLWMMSPLILAMICFITLMAPGETQALMFKLSLEELAGDADSVVVGTVIERTSQWNADHTMIYSTVVVSLEENLKSHQGTAGKNRITLTIPGGEVGRMKLVVSDAASFVPGDKAVFFLKQLSQEQVSAMKLAQAQVAEPVFELHGKFQGKVDVKDGKAGNTTLPQFKQQVNTAIQKKASAGGGADKPREIVTNQTAGDGSPLVYYYSYSGWKWPGASPVVSYRINENYAPISGEGAAVQAAAATWNAVPAKSFAFSYAGTTSATLYGYNGVNEILWRYIGASSIVAQTWIWHIDSTIVENDMEFNTYYTWSTAATTPGGQMDVQTVALHEFGHYLCLNDLYDAGDSAKVMYGYVSSGSQKRALHADDIAGMQYIYGPQKLLGADDADCGGLFPGNYLAMMRFQAIETGNVTSLRLKAYASGNVKVAIYTDNAGQPGSRLNSVDTSTTVSAGWNSITIPSTAVVNGSYYWLAFNSDAQLACYQYYLPGTYRYKAATYSGFTFPDTAGTGFASIPMLGLMAGWGTTGSSPLAITTASLPDGIVGASYSQTLQASGGTGSYSWSITVGSLPAGLNLTAGTGVISGTPTATGTSNFTVQVNDGTSTVTQALSITVTNPPPLSVTTTSLPDGSVGVSYSQALQATGGIGSYSWAITVGSLPAGLNLTSGTGVISGTPTTTGTSNFTVQVTSGASTATKALSITVTSPPQKLLGADDTVCGGLLPGSYFAIMRFQAVETGNVTSLRLKAYTGGNVKVAIYADNAGEPGNRLNSVDTSTAVSAGWNNIAIPSTSVVNGSYYWLAFNSDVQLACYRYDLPGTYRYKAATYSGFTFPDTAGTGFASINMLGLMAGWGPAVPPVPPDPPSLSSPGAAITFKWNASTGATKYWLQVNTQSDFNGTNIINADVGNVTAQEVSGFTLGTTCYWRVRAGNAGGWSSWSSTRSVLANTVP